MNEKDMMMAYYGSIYMDKEMGYGVVDFGDEAEYYDWDNEKEPKDK